MLLTFLEVQLFKLKNSLDVHLEIKLFLPSMFKTKLNAFSLNYLSLEY